MTSSDDLSRVAIRWLVMSSCARPALASAGSAGPTTGFSSRRPTTSRGTRP